MASYQSPEVYIQDVPSALQTVEMVSASIGAMFGVTRSGVANTLVKIGSWTDFIENFAKGLDSPFTGNSYLPYAVYGFFQNGGQTLYVANIRKNAVKATITGDGIKATAATAGVWANGMKVKVAQSTAYTQSNLVYDVTVTLGSSFSVTVKELTFATAFDALNANDELKDIVYFEKAASATTAFVVEEVTLAGGTEGDTLADADYVSALSLLDTIDDVMMVAVPGQTSAVVNDALLSYCDANKMFPIIDAPIGSTPEQAKTLRKNISAFTGALVYPWGKTNDPLTDSLKIVPAAGHVMGVYARTIENRGVFKAPAGVDAVVRGFVEMETKLRRVDVDTLNPVGVICITSRPNAGIVIWGARSLNSADSEMKYVSDGLMNLSIKRSLYQGTQFAVFEPNNQFLWTRVIAAVSGFLDTMFQEGAFSGDGEGTSYFVKCDSSNNTDATISAGQLNIDVGYAPVKPAEFIVFRLQHSVVAASS